MMLLIKNQRLFAGDGNSASTFFFTVGFISRKIEMPSTAKKEYNINTIIIIH